MLFSPMLPEYGAGVGGMGEHLVLHCQNRGSWAWGALRAEGPLGGLRSIHQLISDPRQCSCTTILPFGLKDWRKRRRRRRRRRKMAVHRTTVAYGRQQKRERIMIFTKETIRCAEFVFLSTSLEKD